MTSAADKDTSSATWKFDFLDTVNADPLATGACLGVIGAYLNFASKDDPRAFCSLDELMIRTGASRPTVLKARRCLEQLGYLKVLFVTAEGATMYELCNVRKEEIDAHIAISRGSIAASKRERKRTERRAAKDVCGGQETLPPKIEYEERNFTPVWKESLPNTVEESRRVSCSEEKDRSPWGDDPFLHPPADLSEARIWLTSICTDRSRLAEALILLACNQLTPEFVKEISS